MAANYIFSMLTTLKVLTVNAVSNDYSVRLPPPFPRISWDKTFALFSCLPLRSSDCTMVHGSKNTPTKEFKIKQNRGTEVIFFQSILLHFPLHPSLSYVSLYIQQSALIRQRYWQT